MSRRAEVHFNLGVALDWGTGCPGCGHRLVILYATVAAASHAALELAQNLKWTPEAVRYPLFRNLSRRSGRRAMDRPAKKQRSIHRPCASNIKPDLSGVALSPGEIHRRATKPQATDVISDLLVTSVGIASSRSLLAMTGVDLGGVARPRNGSLATTDVELDGVARPRNGSLATTDVELRWRCATAQWVTRNDRCRIRWRGATRNGSLATTDVEQYGVARRAMGSISAMTDVTDGLARPRRRLAMTGAV